jgi:hypothetical protein
MDGEQRNKPAHMIEAERGELEPFECQIDDAIYVFFIPKEGVVGLDLALYKAVTHTTQIVLLRQTGITNLEFVDDHEEFMVVASIIDRVASGEGQPFFEQ